MRPASYCSMTDAWEEAASALVEHGDTVAGRGGEAVEVRGACFRLLFPRSAWTGSVRRPSKAYAAGELLWYLSGSDSGAHIQAYAPSYGRFLQEDGRAYGAYGARWKSHNQLESVVGALSKDPATRQAVVACWHPADLAAAATGRIKDVPCTLSLDFLLRGGKLDLVVTMRSNDWWLGMPYDVWCFTAVQCLIAAACGADVGWYQHQVGSLHAYADRTAELLRAAELAASPVGAGARWPDRHHGHCARISSWATLREQLEVACAEERRIREDMGGPRTPRREVLELLGGEDSLLGSAVVDAASKFREAAGAER